MSMTRFLKSVLFPNEGNVSEEHEKQKESNEELRALRARVESLEKELLAIKSNQSDLAKCTQQIAVSLVDMAKETASMMTYIYESEGILQGATSNEIELSKLLDKKMFN